MTIESIAPITGVAELNQSAAAAKTEVAAAGFGDWFSNEINTVNERLIGVDRSMQQLAVGGGNQSLHEVMINLEEARLSFQLLVQVRNRLLEAYQDVMRMQV